MMHHDGEVVRMHSDVGEHRRPLQELVRVCHGAGMGDQQIERIGREEIAGNGSRVHLVHVD